MLEVVRGRNARPRRDAKPEQFAFGRDRDEKLVGRTALEQDDFVAGEDLLGRLTDGERETPSESGGVDLVAAEFPADDLR